MNPYLWKLTLKSQLVQYNCALSVAQHFHLSAAFRLLQRPCTHYPNADDRHRMFSTVCVRCFLFSEWVVKPIERADMPKSLPPFMFCFLACRKEEGEELLLVMPHNTSTLTASFNIYFLPFSGLTVNMLISVILLLETNCRRKKTWMGFWFDRSLLYKNCGSWHPSHNHDTFFFKHAVYLCLFCHWLPLGYCLKFVNACWNIF